MNRLKESTSIHWHGLLLPPAMDGVPGVSFAGIEPGATFTYTYPVRQSGTYWYHSHSGLQEQSGVYGPMIIDPLSRSRFATSVNMWSCSRIGASNLPRPCSRISKNKGAITTSRSARR